MLKTKQTNRPLILAAVMLAMFMAAVEATIVATAMPGITAELGGFSHYSWVFSSYLLMQVVMIPIYGKLSDLYGRKLIFSIGVSIFLLGSIFCGLAWSMDILIIGRFIQGMGAGAVQPIAMTIVGDIYSKEERAKIQGYLSSIWGVSAIIGPLLGAFFIEYTHWAWVFWVNVPFGIFAILIIVFFLQENVEKKKHAIDFGGAGLLFIAIATFMLVLTQIGDESSFSRMSLFIMSIISIVSFIWFILHERKVKEPIITLSLWKRKEIKYANLASFTSGAMILAISTFIPTYVQGVLNQPPLIAGMTLTVMSIGWPLSSMIAGRLMLKIGFRMTALIGGIALVANGVIFLLLPVISHYVWVGFGSFMFGIGMGFSMTTFIVSIQTGVEWKVRGEATAMNMFMRLLGGAVGVAILGGVLNGRLRAFFEREGAALSMDATADTITTLLDSAERAKLSIHELAILQQGLSKGLFAVFISLFVLAVLSFIFIILLPEDKKEQTVEN